MAPVSLLYPSIISFAFVSTWMGNDDILESFLKDFESLAITRVAMREPEQSRDTDRLREYSERH